MLEDWVDDVEVETAHRRSTDPHGASGGTDLAKGAAEPRDGGAEGSGPVPALERSVRGGSSLIGLSLIRRVASLALLAAALVVLAIDEPPEWASELSTGVDGARDPVSWAGLFRTADAPATPRVNQVAETMRLSRDQVFSGANVLTRDAWRAAPLLSATDELGKPWRITVHHSGGGVLTAEDFAGTARILRAIQRDHQERRRWVDIGYHYIVDRAGRVWEGRPARWIGAHAGSNGANQGNLGILVLGNFDEQSPSGPQIEALTLLVETLRDRHKIPRASVFTHAEVRATHGMAATECPGRDLAGWVDSYRHSPAETVTVLDPIGHLGARKGD